MFVIQLLAIGMVIEMSCRIYNFTCSEKFRKFFKKDDLLVYIYKLIILTIVIFTDLLIIPEILFL